MKITRFLISIVCVSIVFGLVLWLLVAYGTKEKASLSPSRIKIVTSFYPLFFLANEIGKDNVDVTTITPPGAEPHEYELTAQDIVSISRSDILILHGLLEPWAENIQKNLQKSSVNILNVGKLISTQTYTNESDEESIDPHVWLSPLKTKTMAELITKQIITIDPENEHVYTNNNAILQEKLDILHKSFSDELKDCNLHTIVTTHAAFGYMASEYNFRQLPIYGLSPDGEPSLQSLATISDFAKNTGVKYIFFETLVSPKLAETIAIEIGAKTLVLNPLEGLSTQEINDGSNYFTEMQNNLRNLKIALACQ